MDPWVRTHAIARSAILAVLTAVLLAFAFAVPAAAAAPAAQDVVVTVTAGANDPVSGATVVARDDRTGRAVSNVTTTGDLGYGVIRLQPGLSSQRITITATGGRSQALGPLSAADVLSATAQRGAIAADIEVNVNPGSTVLAGYLDARPGASIAGAERTVARRLNLPSGTDVADSARFARARFSGADFIKTARGRGGVRDYADWAAGRIGAGAAVRSFAAPRPVDDLPLRRAAGSSTGATGQRREQSVAESIVGSLLSPLLDLGATKLYCYLGLAEMCADGAAPAPSSADMQRLADVERSISNLTAQMTTVQQELSAVDVQVTNLGGQVATLGYLPEMNAVDDVLSATRIAAGLRAEGRDVPTDVRDALTNALVRRYGINSGCPNWAALVGALPRDVVLDGAAPRYPQAACASLAQGIGTENGLLQFAQRRVAAASTIVMAGTTQARVDSAGAFWLGEFARNVFATNAASVYALRPGGNSTRSAAAVGATGQLFSDVIEAIDLDASGAYFGTRIPRDQVLVMGPSAGTLYGIGSFKDPGDCRGNTPAPTYWFRSDVDSITGYLPSGFSWDTPMESSRPMCTAAQVAEPPSPIPGAPDDLAWASSDGLPAGQLPGVLAPLRRAALCHLEEAMPTSSASLRTESGTAAGALCDSYPAALPDRLALGWQDRSATGSPVSKMGQLPNLQLSLRQSACVPWEVGFTSHQTWLTGPKESKHYPLTSANGMQCPVVDLTPQAASRNGWNCVSANPAGKIAYGSTIYGASLPPVPVTSSLAVLNTRAMGGYCPNLGGRAAPPGSANVSYFTSRGPTWANSIVCSPGLATLSKTAVVFGRTVDDNPCVASFATNLTDSYSDFPVVWPLQRMMTALTSYYYFNKQLSEFRNMPFPGYKVENWTYNNDVAGDYVVGPLYTSSAVGAYVPGTTPGGPAPNGIGRSGQRAPQPVSGLSVCGEPCTGDQQSVRVDWRAPASSGGLALRKYEVRAQTTPGRRLVGSCSVVETHCVIGGLDLSGDIVVTVVATNALGASGQVSETFSVGPGRPTVRPRVESLEVSWTKPAASSWADAETRGVDVRYTATASPGGRTCTVSGVDSSTCTITGLTPGVDYTVTVTGIGSFFCSAKFPCEFETPGSPPSATTSPLAAATSPGAPEVDRAASVDGRIEVSWRVPASDGGSPIVGYTATAAPGGATCTTTGSLSCVLDGLSPGTAYSVSVTATNAVGTGPASGRSRTSTPAVLPGVPRTPMVQTSHGSLEVRWVAPAFDGGAVVTGYTATASPGGAQCSTDGATTCTITGVPDGSEYRVTVTAANAVGTGPASAAAAARTPNTTAPDAPAPPVLKPLSGRLEVGWSPPVSDGGVPVTGYVATATPGGATCTTAGATLCVIRGLENGTAYRVTVAAINAIGRGPASGASDEVAPQRDDGTPGAAGGLDLQPVAVPGAPVPFAPSVAPDPAPDATPVAGPALALTGATLTPRTLVPGLGGRISYTLSEAANVTITFARVGARDRRSREVYRIPASRPGALAGDTRIRVLYSLASARRKVAGRWTMTIEARDAQGGVARKTIPIRVRT